MKTFDLLPLSLVAAVLIFSACKKNKDAEPDYAKAESFMEERKAPEQQFTGSATTGFEVTGQKGTKISFPSAAFVDADGNPVTGTVKVSLKEVYGKRAILLNGPMTESNGQLLESGGELLVKAEQGGKELRVNPKIAFDDANGIRVEVPRDGAAPRDMLLFVEGKREQPQGGSNNNPYVNPNTWMPAPYAPFGSGPNAYFFTLPSFTWVNVDRFYNDPRPKTTITVSPVFADDNNVTDLQVMLVFKDITTVTTLPFNMQINKFESYINSLPVGIECDLVITGKDSQGFIQFGSAPITIGAGQHYGANIKRCTAAEVDAYLNSIQ